MSHEIRTIHVAPEGELAGLLDMANSAPLLLEKEGLLYRVQRDDAEPDAWWQHYGPDRVKCALDHSAGTLAGVDPAQLLADIHAQRQQKSKGRPA